MMTMSMHAKNLKQTRVRLTDCARGQRGSLAIDYVVTNAVMSALLIHYVPRYQQFIHDMFYDLIRVFS